MYFSDHGQFAGESDWPRIISPCKSDDWVCIGAHGGSSISSSKGSAASQLYFAEHRVFLHTKRPLSDVNKVKEALLAAGYSVFGVDEKVDYSGGNGVDYSTKDGSRDFQPEAENC